METITATVFGQQVEVQEGESSELIDATTQFLATFLDEETIGLEEIAVILCEPHCAVSFVNEPQP